MVKQVEIDYKKALEWLCLHIARTNCHLCLDAKKKNRECFHDECAKTWFNRAVSETHNDVLC